MSEDLRRLTNAGLAENLRREAQTAVPGNVRRDWIIAPLLMEACARLVMASPRDPLATARDERLIDTTRPAMYAIRVETGAGLIAMERQRQIDVEGYGPGHDDDHDESQLAWAAVCYAAPERVYRFNGRSDHAATFRDPWPFDEDEDKRQKGDISPAERERELVKAGALIAAEIDRIRRIHPTSLSATCSVECNGWDRPQGPGHARECPNWRAVTS